MPLSVVRILATIVILGLGIAFGDGASADEGGFQGKTVVVNATGDALIVWDATPELIAIVHEKLNDRAANEKLERDGLKALAYEMGSLSSPIQTVTLRIIYAKTGDVNPAYRAATFSGVERYANIVMRGADVSGNREHWTTLPAGRPMPHWIHYTITGALPPR